MLPILYTVDGPDALEFRSIVQSRNQFLINETAVTGPQAEMVPSTRIQEKVCFPIIK